MIKLMLSIPILLLAVACTGLNTSPLISPTDMPAPLTSPTRSNTPTAPIIAATLAPTVVQPTNTAALKPATTVAPPPASTPANAPRIISFTAVPTTTQTLGEKINVTWEAKGAQATICPYIIGSGGPAEQTSYCTDVSLAGTKTITISESSLRWTGLLLRVTSGTASDRALVSLQMGCKGFRDWFFANPPNKCPEAAPVRSSAAAQHFQRGLMVWFRQPDTFHVFYYGSGGSRVLDSISAPYSFKPGASANNRVGETPPAGLYEPVSGFGQVWRGEIEGAQDVRQRLGWASDKEFNFDTSYQCEIANHSYRLWMCYQQGPDGIVFRLRPDSEARVRTIWSVW